MPTCAFAPTHIYFPIVNDLTIICLNNKITILCSYLSQFQAHAKGTSLCSTRKYLSDYQISAVSPPALVVNWLAINGCVKHIISSTVIVSGTEDQYCTQPNYHSNYGQDHPTPHFWNFLRKLSNYAPSILVH